MLPLDLVALVDDDEADQYIYARILKKGGLAKEVRQFYYADDALTFLRTPDRPNIDLIIADLNMPRMNGFEFADAFNALYPELKAGTLLFMLTGSISPTDQNKAEQHPAIDDFVRKPPQAETLADLIQKHRQNRSDRTGTGSSES